MGLLVMILGLVLFLGAHTLTTQREVRSRVIAASGEGGYKLGYALVSIGGLALIAWGFGHYRATGFIDVWERWCSPEVLRILKHLTIGLMLPAAPTTPGVRLSRPSGLRLILGSASM